MPTMNVSSLPHHLFRALYDGGGGGLFSSKRIFVIGRFWREADIRRNTDVS